jgi:hypothetical protein
MHEALALVRCYGNPHFFTTMTTNPHWPEIREQLCQGQNAADRPDVVCQVFYRKLRQLLADLKTGYIFSTCASYFFYAVEFQKRGLPHAHIVVQLDLPQPFKSARDEVRFVDEHISARLPNKTEDREMVEKFMIHHCSTLTCRRNNQHCCRYGFPKPPRNATWFTEAGFPLYRRGQDDANIVPHSLKLLKRYNTHLNVEYCGNCSVLAYLHKYLTKGEDTTHATLYDAKQQQDNERIEIDRFLKASYVSASQATWCSIFAFPTHSKWPAVETINVFPGSQQLQRYFRRPRAGTIAKDVRFTVPAHFDSITLLDYYQDYVVGETPVKPPKPNWEDMDGLNVHQRAHAKVVRLSWIDPRAGENFFLRLLLQHRAAYTIEDLKAGYATFAEACLHLRLVEPEKEWELAMYQAVNAGHSPHSLRRLFVLCCVFGTGSSNLELMMKFQNEMMADLLPRNLELGQPMTDQQKANMGIHFLTIIEQLLLQSGKSLLEVGIGLPPALQREVQHAIDNPTEQTSPLEFQRDDREIFPPEQQNLQYEHNFCQLNQEQRTVFMKVKTAVDGSHPLLLLLQAKAGTGKTFLLSTLAAYVRSMGQVAVCCAYTGIAALQYPGGKTLHITFQLPLDSDIMPGHSLLSYMETSSNKLKQAGGMAWQRLVECKIILWDEVAMARRIYVEAVDRLMRLVVATSALNPNPPHEKAPVHTMTTEQAPVTLSAAAAAPNQEQILELMETLPPFGGKIVVCAGDFRQLPPVVMEAGMGDVFDYSFVASPLFSAFQLSTLTISMRQKQDEEFVQWADSLGEDSQQQLPTNTPVQSARLATTTSTASRDPGSERLVVLPLYKVGKVCTNVDDALRWLYGYLPPQQRTQRSLICTNNHYVDEANHRAPDLLHKNQRLRICKSDNRCLEARQEGQHHAHNLLDLPEKYMQSVRASGVPPHELRLCINMAVVLLRNLAPEARLVNGTRGIIQDLLPKDNNLPPRLVVLAIEGECGDNVRLIPRINFTIPLMGKSIHLCRCQFPLAPAYAVTVHKAQGKTLNRAVVDTRHNFFDYGQLYTAVTRVRCFTDLGLLINENQTTVVHLVNMRILTKLQEKMWQQHQLNNQSAETAPQMAETAAAAAPVILQPEIPQQNKAENHSTKVQQLLDSSISVPLPPPRSQSTTRQQQKQQQSHPEAHTSTRKPNPKPRPKPESKPPVQPKSKPVKPKTSAVNTNSAEGDLSNDHIIAIISKFRERAPVIVAERMCDGAISLEALRGELLNDPPRGIKCFVIHDNSHGGHFIAARMSNLHTNAPRAELWDSLTGGSFASVEATLQRYLPTLDSVEDADTIADHTHAHRHWEIQREASEWQINQAVIFSDAISACGAYAAYAMWQLAEGRPLNNLIAPSGTQLREMRQTAAAATGFEEPSTYRPEEGRRTAKRLC